MSADGLRVVPLGRYARNARRTSLVIGNFDGVHRGHAAVLDQAVKSAHTAALATDLEPAVLTFDPHPAAVLGRGEPARLTTLATRALLLEKRGIERLYIRRFDREFASWTPEEFVARLLVRDLSVAEVIVGENFRFGHKRAGDLATLVELGKTFGFVARAHAVAGDESGPFSSTRVRGALERGDAAEAARVLGRAPSFAGVVVHGDARGRTLGFPTANLAEIAELVPANGVYAVRVSDVARVNPVEGLASELEAERSAEPLDSGIGVMNIGVRPTVAGGSERRVEVHVLRAPVAAAESDASSNLDLYGRRLRIDVVRQLRHEQRFAGLDALKAQIAKDSEDARRILS